MKATTKILELFEVVADMTESEWSHAINRMFEQKNASITSKVKLEDTEAMERDFERFTP